MRSGTHANLPYVPALDGIRAIAIILVFLFHTANVRGGWVGVDVFFTLSGYLITLILTTEYEANGSIHLGKFFFRRACRLLPAAVVFIGFAVALSFCLNDQRHETNIDAIAALLYLEDFRYAFSYVAGTNLAHLWSLSVEEQFYLVWPFLLILSLSLFGRIGSFYTAIIGIIIVISWRFLLVSEIHSPPYYRIYFSFDTRIDELLIGSALALWGPQRAQAIIGPFRHLWPIVIAFFIVIVIKVNSGRHWETVESYPLIGAAAACLIVVATGEEKNILSRFLTLAPLVALGRISYGFYLWHYLIIHEVSMGGFTKLYVTFFAFALTLVVSIGSYSLIERPLQRFRRQDDKGGPEAAAPR